MKQSKLTIITVCFNAEQFIEFTLKSVADQTNQDFEYLIIDGLSMDATLKIVKKNAPSFKNLRVLSEKDAGLYDAMNKALLLAKGNFVWFLNAGDIIVKNNVVSEIIAAIDAGHDLIYSDTIFMDESRDELGLRSDVTVHDLPRGLCWQDFKYGMKVCHQSFVVKKEIAPNYLLNNLSADLDWEIACFKFAVAPFMLQNPISKYLLGGVSNQKHKESLIGRFRILAKHFGFFNTIFNHFWILIRSILFKMKRRQ